MGQQSPMRRLKRLSMRANGNTFTQRVREAVRTGKPVEPVNFRMQAPGLKVKA